MYQSLGGNMQVCLVSWLYHYWYHLCSMYVYIQTMLSATIVQPYFVATPHSLLTNLKTGFVRTCDLTWGVLLVSLYPRAPHVAYIWLAQRHPFECSLSHRTVSTSCRLHLVGTTASVNKATENVNTPTNASTYGVVRGPGLLLFSTCGFVVKSRILLTNTCGYNFPFSKWFLGFGRFRVCCQWDFQRDQVRIQMSVANFLIVWNTPYIFS